MSTDVRFFHSGMAGAPSLSNAAGSLIAVLDGCLINGFNALAVTSIAVLGGVALVTFAASHGFGTAAQYVTISGATPAGLNGSKKVLTTPNSNQLTFDATGIADQSATGTISAKRPPIAGWSKAFSSGNKAAYRSVHASALGMFLQIDDSAVGQYQPARGYESMTDVDTGTNPFPLTATASVWEKNNSASARAWALVGDGRRFYLFVASTGAGGLPWFPVYFGDINPYRTGGDAYACALFATVGGQYYIHNINNAQASPAWAFARASNGVLGAIGTNGLYGHNAYVGAGYFGQGLAYPDPLTGGAAAFRPVHVRETLAASNNAVRGEMPGLIQALHAIGSNLNNLSLVPMFDNSAYPSGLLWVYTTAGTGFTTSGGTNVGGGMLFDLDNPW